MRKLYEFESLSKLEVGIVISEERILIVLVWNMVTNKIFYKKTFSSTINTLNLGQKCTSGILLHQRELTIWTSL